MTREDIKLDPTPTLWALDDDFTLENAPYLYLCQVARKPSEDEDKMDLFAKFPILS